MSRRSSLGSSRQGSKSPAARSRSRSRSRSSSAESAAPRRRILAASSSRSPSPNIRKRPRDSSSSDRGLRSRAGSSDSDLPRQELKRAQSSDDEGGAASKLGLEVSSDEDDEVVAANSGKKRESRVEVDSDSDNEELAGAERRVGVGMKREAPVRDLDDSDDEVLVRRGDSPMLEDGGGNDFERMMARKRAENKRFRKKKDIDVINENDDAIAKMIADMRIAAKEDRDLNIEGKPGINKMKMFPRVMSNLNKGELRLAFVEANLLSVMTDWLAPMPDKGLPHVNMRSAFLKLLQELKIEDPSRLKESGIGKAVMYLYRHPKETRDNKVLAGHIINEWARPIFRKEDNLAHMTREERRERDDYLAKRRQGKKKKKVDDVQEALKPGDPGWVSRARVPMPDAQEYIRRPEWQNNEQIGTVKKKTVTLLEKHKRKFAEKRRQSRNVSMTKISIEGARMGLGQDGLNVG